MEPISGTTWPGPVINGRPTTVHLLNGVDLKSSAFLEGYFHVVNAAFSHCHPPYIPSDFRRFINTDQILAELGPDAFTFVVSQQTLDGDRVIATGSAVPAPDHGSEAIVRSKAVEETTVSRSAAARTPIPGIADWELKHVCVLSEAMRQGLAGHILVLLNQQILARTKLASRQDVGLEVTQCEKLKARLMITTIKELNGPWYQKRGYQLIEHSCYPAGTLEGTAPFSIWHMDKILD